MQRCVLTVLSVSLLAWWNPTFAQADVELTLRASFEPTRMVGLLISPQKTIERSDVKFRKTDDGTFLVSFAVGAEDLSPETAATALAVSAQGELAFADVRPVSLPGVDKSYLSLPFCEPLPAPVPDPDVFSNVALLDSLHEVRSTRRDVLQLKIQQIMKGDFLERLQAMEQGFGISYTADLSGALPPPELTDRLQRILHALRALKRK